MQFTNYSAFRDSVRWAMDAGQPGIPPARPVQLLDMVIAMGEQRVHRDLRAATMVSDLSVAVSSNAATLPSDLLELKEVRFSGKAPLDVIGLDRLRALEAGDDSTGADTRFCAQDGDTLRFWPTASGTVLGRYYARPTALATITWASATTFARYPETYLYAALCESAPLIGRDPEPWESKYRLSLSDAMQDEHVRVFNGGPLRIRSR
jgi:hypothetical protein